MNPARQVYVISDLHLGGVYGEGSGPNDRGFRICTHAKELAAFVQALAAKPAGPTRIELVINGDFVDFLAEGEEGGGWVPFRSDPGRALVAFESILERDALFFDAVRDFLGAGHRCVIVLGNHDVELSFPAVRRRLFERIGADGADCHFLYDGEAYVVGDVLIEHGNRYDGFNVVDHGALRRLRSLQSRNQQTPAKWEFQAPPGSHMVAEVMNPIKEDYRFVDLLKPETGAVVPILLALEPGYRKVLARVAKIAHRASKFSLETPAMPSIGGDIHASGDAMDFLGGDISSGKDPVAAEVGEGDALDAVLRESLGEDTGEFLAGVSDVAAEDDLLGGDISTRETIGRAVGFARLLFARDDDRVQRRLSSLLAALRALQNDRTFDDGIEGAEEYLDAARELCGEGGFRCVVFGHTHLAKRIDLGDGSVYLNTGTWADLIKFPTDAVTGSDAEALAKLGDFVEDLQSGDLAKWIHFRPTYARIDLDADDHMTAAEVCDFDDPAVV